MSRRRDRQLLGVDNWDARDWREHLAEKATQPLNETPTPPPPAHTIPAGFSLNAEAQRRRVQEERRIQVDSFLAAMKVRPRRAR
jgi:hypothetical protein